MSYLKIVDDKIVEAPKNTIRGDLQIFGYNRDVDLMKQDGYTYYPKAAACYQIIDGVIVQIKVEQPTVVIKRNYSKLDIRRACRTLDLQHKLNKLINATEQIAADWADANQIDLEDEMFIKAIEFGLFEQQQIDAVKQFIGG